METSARNASGSRTAKDGSGIEESQEPIEPPFLLNTLNNIYALIAFNCDKAQEAVQELSKLLRHVLYDNQQTFVPLEKELDFIRNYVALMRIRLPQQVEISLHLETDPGSSLLIAPLLFISLIENAFKHGISPTAHSFISIAITGNTDGTVRCEILNSNYPKTGQDKSGSGIGLEQVSKRLELIYPKHYEWEKGISANGQVYSSIINHSNQKFMILNCAIVDDEPWLWNCCKAMWKKPLSYGWQANTPVQCRQ
mgnify:CR=1 FL=1